MPPSQVFAVAEDAENGRAASPDGQAHRLWRALTESPAVVTDSEDRWRGRLHAGALVFLVPIVAVVAAAGVGLRVATGQGLAVPGTAIQITTALLLLAAFVVGHTKHFRWGMRITVTALLWNVWSNWAIAPLDPERVAILYFTIIGVLLAALLLDFYTNVAVAAANFLMIMLAPFLLSAAAGVAAGPFYDFSLALFVFLTSGVALIAAAITRRDRRLLAKAHDEVGEAQRAQAQLVHNVAHELRAPLTPMSVQLYIWQNHPDRAHEASVIIQRNLSHLERLVNDLLDVARIQSGRLELDAATVRVDDVARKAVESLTDEATRRGVRLTVHTDGDLSVNADAQRITQVLYNLVGNAIKFTPAGGEVSVEAKRRGPEACLLVRDTGRGLQSEEMERLFRPFSQVHDRTQYEEKGTGLGLFISKQLVQAHGGRIWVESPGRDAGSTFSVALPLHVGDSCQADARQPGASGTVGM